jgi:hypothetical protein
MRSRTRDQAATVDLTAVVIAVTDDDPRVLVVRRGGSVRTSLIKKYRTPPQLRSP